MHLHRSEEEHYAIVAGSHRIAIGAKSSRCRPGLASPFLRVRPHSWRNISREPGRMVVILTPEGFEQCVQTIRNSPPEKLEAVAGIL
jgi:uncharacterized cupin superfamily protein